MIENIKVDIIYFMTATDFEFEFNLGGCCHMRLLNDKVNDKKAFVNSLARAVSRSQIILAVGPLFGEDGLITTAAAAISHSLQTVDNKAYGIASEDKIEVIEGGVPLVTNDGIFGGCIVESGNQSIIVLTENRTVRKSLMKTLVHPYIEDICIMQSTGKSGVSPVIEPVAQPVAPAEELTPPEEAPVPDNATEQSEQPPETVPEEPEVPAEDDIVAEIEPREPGENSMEFEFFDSEEEQSEPQDEFSGEIGREEEDLYMLPEEDEQQKRVKKSKGLNITILIVSAVLLLVVFAILYFLIFLPFVGGISTSEYFKEIFNTVSKV